MKPIKIKRNINIKIGITSPFIMYTLKNNKITCNPCDCRTISTIDRPRVIRRIHIVFLIAIGMKLRRW